RFRAWSSWAHIYCSSDMGTHITNARRRQSRRLRQIRPETRGRGHRPGVAEARIAGAVQQLALGERWVQLRKGHHFASRDTPRKVHRLELARVVEAGRGGELDQRVHGRGVEDCDPLELVADNERALARAVLRGD